MASAEIKKPEPQPEPEDVILRLTQSEARVLRTITGAIGGDHNGRGRRATRAIFNALSPVFEVDYDLNFTGKFNG